MTKEIVYICWVEKDRRWYGELHKFLHPLTGHGISLWDHSTIEVGPQSVKTLRQALTHLRLAVLLISQDFLNSERVRKLELPILLAAQKQGVPLFCIYVDYSSVTGDTIEYKEGWITRSRNLTDFSSFKDNRPDFPLAAIRHKAERNRVLCNIADEICSRAIAQLPTSAAPDSKANPYLLVSIHTPPQPPQPRPTAPSTCRLRAWLLGLSDAIALSTPADDIALAELPEQLSHLRNEAFRHLQARKIPAERFPVEFLLPQCLLAADVDQWTIQGPLRSLMLGRAHPVVVRPLERALYPEFAVRHQARWLRFRAVAQKRAKVAMLDQAEATVAAWLRAPSPAGTELAEQLTDCDVVCAVLPEPPLMDTLDSLLEAGVPVALWTRRTCEEGYLSGLVEQDRLDCLPQRVWAARKAAGKAPQQEHGSHLTLLWDDPERQPPDVIDPLQPPLRVHGEES